MNATELARLLNREPLDVIRELEKHDIDPSNLSAQDIKYISPLFSLPEPVEPETMTVEEAAERSGYSPQAIYKMMAQGEIEFEQRGRRRYPYIGSLLDTRPQGMTQEELIDSWMEKNPALRLHVLRKYGIEEILYRLDKLCSS